MNIYVGNLSFDTTEEDLQNAFSSYGTITSVAIIKDKFSGESRGFGFVEMSSNTEARKAIEGLGGTELRGRTLNVNEARPREERGGGGDRNRGYNDRGSRRNR
ncbi:MAG: RNA-binding protein [Chloroflexi bacterium]|nr:RNA-binding protein [Chloroflexota bacterium]MCI0578192.1 RNA-binding protein [Chloroflexota bacterium]MCI0645315.1 RNA-binding protein [Chloroflexota bacterium]MCI0729531.1 RNA-binding protein [Chloroflexota bacterium]